MSIPQFADELNPNLPWLIFSSKSSLLAKVKRMKTLLLLLALGLSADDACCPAALKENEGVHVRT
jgi:hypothetical protein